MGFGPGYVINSTWYRINERERGELLFSLLLIGLALNCMACLLIGFFSDNIFSMIAGDDWSKIRPLFPFLLIAAVSIIPLSVFNSWVIIAQKARLSSTVKIVHIFLGSSTIVLVAMYTQNYQYIIIGNVLVGLFISLVQFYLLRKILHVSFHKRWFFLIYRVASPIFLRSIFNILRTQFDRIIMSRFFGADQFALYNFSGKINIILNEVSVNYQNAYDPHLYKGLSEKNLNVNSLRSILFGWGYILLLCCAVIIVFGEDIIDVFTNGVFMGAYPLVILYTCVLVITLPFMGNGQVVIFFQKTRYLLVITIVHALLVVLLAVMLIPKYGAPGGIFSLWAGTFVYMLLYFHKKRILYRTFFVEMMLLPYVFLYHLIVTLEFLKFELIASLLVFLLIVGMSIHVYVLNKSTIQNVVSRFMSRNP